MTSVSSNLGAEWGPSTKADDIRYLNPSLELLNLDYSSLQQAKGILPLSMQRPEDRVSNEAVSPLIF